MDDKDIEAASDTTIAAPSFSVPLAFNSSKYAAELSEFDLNDDQKQELLGAIWDIMRTFVDLGFDVAKADVCGQLFGEFNEAAAPAPDIIESGHLSKQESASGKDSP